MVSVGVGVRVEDASFSYVPGNTLVAAVTFVGATQTASHVRG